MPSDGQDADGVDRSVRRDEATALNNTEGHPIILHNVGGKEPDGKPTRLGKWTFGTKMVRDVVLDHVGGRVLNACAGKTRLEKRGCEFFRNDIDEDRDADLHVDVREIHQHLEPETFDSAILDPPFDPGRAEKLYEGWHGQEYSNARDAVAELVCPGGVVVELGWNSWSLSDKDGWEPVEHHIYRQSSFKADVHLTVDRKVNQKRLVTDGGTDQFGDGDTHAFLGDCLECGERMVEVLRTSGGDTRTVQLECEDETCENVGHLRHDFDENPFDDPIVREGVENVRSGMVSWHDCPRCHGHGWVEDPIDDLRRAMNGREHPCPRCGRTGSVLGEVTEIAE